MTIENIKTLSEVAHRSKNFEQSYELNSKLLEHDASNSKAWIYKGIAAGWLSSPEISRLTECLKCIKQGFSKNDDIELKKIVADQLIDIYENFIRKGNKELIEKVTDFNKVPMPEGGFRLLHMATQTIQRNNSAKEQLDAKINALDLLMLGIELNPIELNYSAAINAVNGLLIHSEKNGNYLKDQNSVNYSKVSKLKEDLLRTHDKLFGQANYSNTKNITNINESKSNKSFVLFSIIYYPVMYFSIKSLFDLGWVSCVFATLFGAPILLFIFAYAIKPFRK